MRILFKSISCLLLLVVGISESAAEPSDQAIEEFVREIDLKQKLVMEYSRTVERVANQALMEITQGGAASATDAKWLERVNSVRPIADRAFDADAIIKELHYPYYRQYYTEAELKQLTEYHQMIKVAVEKAVPRSILEARATDFSKTSAGEKYLKLRDQEVLLWDVTRGRIEKISKDSAAEAFSR